MASFRGLAAAAGGAWNLVKVRPAYKSRGGADAATGRQMVLD